MPKGCIKFTTDYFVAKARKAKISGDARYGLVASKRMFKLAVQRNRAKRLMRDWLAFNEEFMNPELDYVFLLCPSMFSCGRELGRMYVLRTLKRITRIHKKNVKMAQSQ